MPPKRDRFTPLAMIGITVVAVLSLAWFVISWLVMGSPLTDAVGETVGTVAVVLLVVSVVGAVRSKDRSQAPPR